MIARQRATYGPKVLALADARSHFWIYLLPFAGLVGVGAYVLARLRRRTAVAESPPDPRPAPGSEAIGREIEEELARIE